MAMSDKQISYVLKKPVKLSVGDSKVEFFSGCCILDVNFTNVKNVEIGEIRFKNFYTASITVKARKKDMSSEPGDIKYHTCVPHLILMPNPHCETGAQDYFSITRKQMTWDLDNIGGLRIILRQPSPIWKDFNIEDIKIFKKEPAQGEGSLTLPEWLSGESNAQPTEGSELVKDVKGGVHGVHGVVVDAVSSDVQQMWALTQQVCTESTKKALGRYDVEGSYEINLLSYT